MDKIIKIDGKDVALKSNARTALVYRAAFGEDILKAQSTFLNIKTRIIEKNGKKESMADVGTIDSIAIAKMIYAMNKTAEGFNLSFDEWLDGFENFPILEIVGEAQELFLNNLQSTTNITTEKK